MITIEGVNMASTEIEKAEHLAPEIEEGNREYKFKLTDLTDDQLTHRITQLNWRLNEGNDEAFYLIGVEDNGNQLGLSDEDLQESLKNLQFIADQVGCDMVVRRLFAGEQGTTAEVHMRRRERVTVDVVQVNVAVAGDLNSGKSSMIGVLCTGQLDNGKGLARTQVLTHNHEVESGRTSCISHHSLHFNKDGEVLNADPLPGTSKSARLRALSDLELADETSRSVVLMDLAGHAKYLKTTLHGLIGRRPDHCIVCVSATTGLNSITTEHIGVCMYLNVPLVIVITKTDCIGRAQASKPKVNKKYQPVNSYADPATVSLPTETVLGVEKEKDGDSIGKLVESVQRVLAGPKRDSKVIRSEAEVVQVLLQSVEAGSGAVSMDEPVSNKPVVPIFTVSNVTGDGLQLLRSYLFQLPTHAKSRHAERRVQSTCVRILGSIGNTDEREEVVFPRDEDLFGSKKESRHSTNRYAVGNKQQTTEALRCTSSSEDNLARYSDLSDRQVAMAATPVSCKASIPRPHSSPDLPTNTAAVTKPSSAPPSPSGGAAGDRDFADFVEAYSSPALSITSSPYSSARDSPCGEGPYSIPPGARTKVLIGSIEAGKLTVGEPMLFGPTGRGDFVSVIVSSLRLSNVPVRCASAGQTVTFKLTECPAAMMSSGDTRVPDGIAAPEGQRRSSATGLVLLSQRLTGESNDLSSDGSQTSRTPSPTANASHWEFEAELLVLNHPSKVRVNYEPVVHVGCVKQSAKIISIRKINDIGNGDAEGLHIGNTTTSTTGSTGTTTATAEQGAAACSDELGNGERGICRFRFLYYPEFIICGDAMIIREQRTRGVGTVTALS